jgi:indole-3-glycerol phosphate synthase
MTAPPAPTERPDLLATIVAAARRITEVRAETIPLSKVERAASGRTPDGTAFRTALCDGPSPRVIAECKRRSPSRGILRQHYDAAEHARSYAGAGAAAISVLTEPTFFDGALEHLAAVRRAVTVPVLRKDFIVTRYQVFEAVMRGADAVLLIVGALSAADLRSLLGLTRDVGVAALVEAHDERELAIAADAGADIIGLNSRDLRSLEVQPELHERLAARLPPETIAVAESGLREPSDLRRLEDAGYHAFLVGERLIVQDDPGAALRMLRDVPAGWRTKGESRPEASAASPRPGRGSNGPLPERSRR